ncbi:RNA cap guanine-N2 methyltransferase,S-adenosyl-L-methionine-dependent methyltransferase [Cinara cedri]|uniref:Trimethylguanosine synthase n=1 Tax=Cinara cedri TaxID=506608 RepID=A0A5E4NCQ8_9HEMI|nr:RNA cap guanine-N2 methyltransferase,S-adenosyl-L-methionine-dependent methyltransferase [Cinara cedri]
MNEFHFNTNTNCKYEILAEISFHSKTSKKQTIKLLCSRILARHRPKENEYEYFDDNDITQENSNLIKEHTEDDYKVKPKLNNALNEEDGSSSIQEQFTNISINESELHTKWYAYWEKNGENFVNETWLKQYGNCTMDDHPMSLEELYEKHREQQYHILYWKFVNELDTVTIETEEHTSESCIDVQCDSSFSEEFDNFDNVSNFDFLYKYRLFQDKNIYLTKAYWALSIIGYIYNDQNEFKSAYVEYLKSNIIKSTRHLNVYKYPKVVESKNVNSEINTKSLNTITNLEKPNNCDVDEQCKSSVTKMPLKKKKVLKSEKWKQRKDERMINEMEKFGYTYLKNNPKLLKFWKKRHLLFSKFEEGIKLDEESWYSVTPEIISSHIAERCSCYLIVDPFCGAGGNIIQFAKTCELVIAIDNDPKKVEMARHNAELYGVADRIEFIIGDYFALAPTLKADVVFLSPPWGGLDFMNLEEYKFSDIMPSNGGGEHMLCLARKITSNIAIHLPKNTNIFDCLKLADDGYVEVQQNMLNSRYNSLTVYFSELYGLCDENI